MDSHLDHHLSKNKPTPEKNEINMLYFTQRFQRDKKECEECEEESDLSTFRR
jgi:hypothetical protein